MCAMRIAAVANVGDAKTRVKNADLSIVTDIRNPLSHETHTLDTHSFIHYANGFSIRSLRRPVRQLMKSDVPLSLATMCVRFGSRCEQECTR